MSAPPRAAALAGEILEALRQDPGPEGTGRGILILDGTGWTGSLAARLALDRLGSGGGVRIVEGVCAGPLGIPFDPFPDVVERLGRDLAGVGPEVAERYGPTLVTLQPRLREVGRLRTVRPFEAWLIRFAFGGSPSGLRDFFRGRNLEPHVVDDLVRFILDAAVELPRPLVLHLDRAERSSAQAVRILGLLAARAGGVPLRLCCVVRAKEGRGPELAVLAESSGWRVLQVPAAAGSEGEIADALESCGPDALEVLEAVAVCGRPVAPGALARALPREHSLLREELESLIARGLLIEQPEGGLWLPSAVDEAVSGGHDGAERRAEFHRHWAETLEEEGTPADLAHHARRAGLPGYGRRSLAAMEWSWLVSAYDEALAHAEHALSDPETAGKVNGRLLLGLLNYEAYRFEEADRYLTDLLLKAKQEKHRIALLRLAGYARVFGTRNYEAGLELLQESLSYYEGQQRHGDIANTLNSMAFAQFALGRHAEALQLESRALEESSKLDTRDSFLSTLIHVNLGRLYRPCDPRRAVEHLRRAIAENEGTMGPHIILLLYGTLGNLYWSLGDLPQALECFHHCANASLDVDLAGAGIQTLPKLKQLFQREVGPLAPARALFGEVYRFAVHFNLGLACRRTGQPDRAAAYEVGLLRQLDLWGEPGLAEGLRDAFARNGEATAPPGAGETALPAFPSPEEILRRHADTLVRARPDDWIEEVVRALEQGEAVAWAHSSCESPGARLLDRMVLFDPRSRAVGERVRRDLGRARRGGGLLALPDSCRLLRGCDPGCRLIVQEVSLTPEARRRFPALVPIRSRAVVLDRRTGSALVRVLEEWSRRTGAGLLGALSLRVSREDLAEGEYAVKVFLETSIELLVLEGALLRKQWGPLDDRNLLSLRVRLGNPVLGSRGKEGAGGPGYIATPGVQAKIGAEGYELLDRVDDKKTVAELLDPVPEGERPEAVRFLRELRRHQVIGFSL